MQYVVGVDLGGTKVATALQDENGEIIKRVQYATNRYKTAEEVIDGLVASVNEVRGDYPIVGVGVASPGAVDTNRGVILKGTNLPNWTNIPLREKMQAQLHLPVKIVNDANAAAWGEYYAGAGKGSKTMIYVTISTGIGAGIVFNHQLFIGNDGYAGELGHTIIHQDGVLCGCGEKGCWEAYASGTSMARIANEAAKKETTLMTKLAHEEGVPINAKHLFSAAKLGDSVASHVVNEVTSSIAVGLKNIIHTFNPDCIVIGGGVSLAGEALFTPLIEKTKKMILAPYRDTFTIVPALLGDDVGIVGAATLLTGEHAYN